MTAYPGLPAWLDRFPWRRHLTLREVGEYELLALASRFRSLSPKEQRRLADLGSRRVRAVVETEAGDAA